MSGGPDFAVHPRHLTDPGRVSKRLPGDCRFFERAEIAFVQYLPSVRLVHVKIDIVTTGGTIEKIYSEQTGQVENLTAKIDRYLQLLRLPDAGIEVMPLMNKDSLEMTEEDRELILAAVRRKILEAPVVITHGTDTMVETGRLLKQRLWPLPHPVVLTGAMTPLGFERSDGLQNLTESLFAARILPPGVWIVMHGQVFDVDRARKDRERARFVTE